MPSFWLNEEGSGHVQVSILRKLQIVAFCDSSLRFFLEAGKCRREAARQQGVRALGEFPVAVVLGVAFSPLLTE